MNETHIEESVFMGALAGDSVSAADITKTTEAKKADVQAALDDYHARGLVEPDPENSTKTTPRWRLTQVGRTRYNVRYRDKG